MQTSKRVEFLRNVLILAGLVGLVLLSWLLGHILRYSNPMLWHPPLQEPDPQIKMGIAIDFEGIPRLATLPGLKPVSDSEQALLAREPGARPAECAGLTYFTSLPAKCLAADGRLVQAPGFESSAIMIPQSK